MMEPAGAGELLHLVRFERRSKTQDGYGNEDGEWSVIIPLCSCKLTPTKANAEVMAQRLQGFVLHDLWTRGDDPDLWSVTDADRVIDMDDPSRVFKVHTPGMDMTGKRRWLLFQLTLGKADG
jgi:hypothetical protein